MTDLLILLAELVGLYLLARQTTKKLYGFFLLVFGHRTIAVTLITLILFPGTVIHELAHLFIAEIFGVRTGKLTLVPENIREEDLPAGRQEIQTGSVAVAATDPFRRAVVGLAPFLVGLTALVIISYFLSPLATYNLQPTTFFLFYLLFAVAASMFPSAPDLKGTPALILTLLLFIVAGYLVGIRIGLTGQMLDMVNNLVKGLINSLKYVLAVDIVTLLATQILVYLTGKIIHRRIIT